MENAATLPWLDGAEVLCVSVVCVGCGQYVPTWRKGGGGDQSQGVCVPVLNMWKEPGTRGVPFIFSSLIATWRPNRCAAERMNVNSPSFVVDHNTAREREREYNVGAPDGQFGAVRGLGRGATNLQLRPLTRGSLNSNMS